MMLPNDNLNHSIQRNGCSFNVFVYVLCLQWIIYIKPLSELILCIPVLPLWWAGCPDMWTGRGVEGQNFLRSTASNGLGVQTTLRAGEIAKLITTLLKTVFFLNLNKFFINGVTEISSYQYHQRVSGGGENNHWFFHTISPSNFLPCILEQN